MKSGSYIPDRGDIVWLNFTPQAGHEQRGKRPAVVISPKVYNQKSFMCICFPITSKVKGYPFEIELPNNLPISGVILSDQIKNLDYTKRDISFIAKAPSSVIKLLQKNILALVG